MNPLAAPPTPAAAPAADAPAAAIRTTKEAAVQPFGKWWRDPALGFISTGKPKGRVKRTARWAMHWTPAGLAEAQRLAAEYGQPLARIVEALVHAKAIDPGRPRRLVKAVSAGETAILNRLANVGGLTNQLAGDAAIIRSKIQRGDAVATLNLLQRIATACEKIERHAAHIAADTIPMPAVEPTQTTTA